MAPLSPRRRCFILLCLAAIQISQAAVQVRLIYYSVLFLVAVILWQKSSLFPSDYPPLGFKVFLILMFWLFTKVILTRCVVGLTPQAPLHLGCSIFLQPASATELMITARKCDFLALLLPVQRIQLPVPIQRSSFVVKAVVTVQNPPDNAGIYGMLHRQIVPMDMWLIKPSGRIRGAFSSWRTF